MIKKLNSANDIDNVSYDILKQSGAYGKFPTPVNKIVQYAELKFDDSPYINEIPKNYTSKSIDFLKKALRKINGILDRKEKIIYLDSKMIPNKKRYVKLHEVGHATLPWQKELYEILEDDEINLSAESKEEFELEANYFASSTLFQLDRFIEEMEKLPLEIGSVKVLAKFFGASMHATIRRYVECSRKRCALLVLKDLSLSEMSCKKRDYFQSSKFTEAFGQLKWNDSFGIEWPFVQDYISNRRFHNDGWLTYSINGSKNFSFDYHFFDNTYNAFVLIKPTGEFQSSKTKFVYSL